MPKFNVSTMTLTSRFDVTDQAFYGKLNAIINEIPVQIDPDDDQAAASVNLVRPRRDKPPMLEIDSGLEWMASRVLISIRGQCAQGTRGRGIVTFGNFRNCVPFRCGKVGVKVFRSGSVQAWGFNNCESFHQFAHLVLGHIGGASVDQSKTRIAMAVLDAKCDVLQPLHLRAVANALARKTLAGESVEYNPDEFAGVKVKVRHPFTPGKTMSLTVRARGGVKLYLCAVMAGEMQDAVEQVTVRIDKLLLGVC